MVQSDASDSLVLRIAVRCIVVAVAVLCCRCAVLLLLMLLSLSLCRAVAVAVAVTVAVTVAVAVAVLCCAVLCCAVRRCVVACACVCVCVWGGGCECGTELTLNPCVVRAGVGELLACFCLLNYVQKTCRQPCVRRLTQRAGGVVWLVGWLVVGAR